MIKCRRELVFLPLRRLRRNASLRLINEMRNRIGVSPVSTSSQLHKSEMHMFIDNIGERIQAGQKAKVPPLLPPPPEIQLNEPTETLNKGTGRKTHKKLKACTEDVEPVIDGAVDLPFWVKTPVDLQLFSATSLAQVLAIGTKFNLTSSQLSTFFSFLAKFRPADEEECEKLHQNETVEKYKSRLGSVERIPIGETLMALRSLLSLRYSPQDDVVTKLQIFAFNFIHRVNVSTLLSFILFHQHYQEESIWSLQLQQKAETTLAEGIFTREISAGEVLTILSKLRHVRLSPAVLKAKEEGDEEEVSSTDNIDLSFVPTPPPLPTPHPVGAPESDSWNKAVELKCLDVVGQMSINQICRLFTILAQHTRRNLDLLRLATIRLDEMSEQRVPFTHMVTLVGAAQKLNYYDQILFNRIGKDLAAHATAHPCPLTPVSTCILFSNFAAWRYRNPKLFQQISDFILKHVEESDFISKYLTQGSSQIEAEAQKNLLQNAQDSKTVDDHKSPEISETADDNKRQFRPSLLVTILVSMAKCNFYPVSDKDFLTEIRKLVTKESLEADCRQDIHNENTGSDFGSVEKGSEQRTGAHAWLDFVWALAVLGKMASEDALSILDNAEMCHRFTERDNFHSEQRALKLLNIDTAAKLDLSPPLEGYTFSSATLAPKLTKSAAFSYKSKSSQLFASALHHTFPNDTHSKVSFVCPQGHFIDALMGFNSEGNILKVEEWEKLSGKEFRDHFGEKALRIAVLLHDFQDHTVGSTQAAATLTGPNALAIKHLQKLDYTLLQIQNRDFVKHSSFLEKVQYVKQKLQAAITDAS